MGLVLMALLAFTAVAFADVVNVDNDIVQPGNQNVLNLTAAPGATVTTSAGVAVEFQGSRHLQPGSSLRIGVSTSQTTLPAGYTVGDVVTTVPSDWNDATDRFAAGSSNISFTAPSTPGPYSYTVKWDDELKTCTSSGDCVTGGNALTINLTVENPTPSDTTPPSLDLPADITAEATGPNGATVSYSASASDLVDGSVAVDCAPASGTVFPLGTTTVNCSATDAAGNTANGSFTVTVRDTTPPNLNLPADITEEATGPNGAAVSYSATASDLVDGSVSVDCTPSSGVTFPLGTTTVSCSATDAAGNTANGSFTVTVRDTTPPSLNLPADITATASSNSQAVVTYSATATDLVDGTVSVNCAPASGSSFPVGPTTVNCSATDAAGNTANGSFTVTVTYSFTGFFQPVDNNGVYNVVKAGSAIPVKFSLRGNQGLNVFYSGYPKSANIPCTASAPLDQIEATVTAGGSSLSYDASADQYTYVWKTDKGWSGTCRQLQVKLADGSTKTANFNFTR